MATIVKWLTFVFWFQHAYTYPQPNIEEVRNWNLEQLKGYLLGHSNALYEKIKSTARHTAHQSGSTVVNVTVNLLGLADVSEWQMNYRVSLELIQAWNQSDWAYGYIFQGVRPEKYIEFDPEREFPRIWSPSTYFVNEITEEKSSFKWQKIVRYDLSKHIFTTPNVICRLYENGTLLLIERTTVRLACLMDLINYPMDEQQCPMKISSFAFSSHEVQYRWDHVRRGPIHLPDHGVQLSEYSISRIEHNVCTVHRKSDIFPCIESTLFLKRNPSSYIVQFYLPSSMFVCLSWLSFYVDIDSVVGRVYFAVFLVVTMVGQMMYILARVPPVAYVKAIDVWMDACLVFVSLVLVEYAIVKVKMKKATRKGLQLGSYFEKKDGDDLSADDIIPEVMKPWSKPGKMKPETIQKDSPKKVSSTLISRQRRMTLKEVKEIRLSRAQHGRPPSFASRVRTRATQELKVMKANEAYFIDVISRVLFPLLFAIFNVIYWSYYLTRY